jgi:hypothetical protein
VLGVVDANENGKIKLAWSGAAKYVCNGRNYHPIHVLDFISFV